MNVHLMEIKIHVSFSFFVRFVVNLFCRVFIEENDSECSTEICSFPCFAFVCFSFFILLFYILRLESTFIDS